MNRSQATLWATLVALIGGGLLYYLVNNVSPRLPDASLNLSGVIGFFLGVLLLVAGMSTALALALHERFPALAGVDQRQPGALPAPEAAVRQGILAAFTAAVLLLLALLRLLDPAFVIVALLLTGLVEAFWQNRPFGRG